MTTGRINQVSIIKGEEIRFATFFNTMINYERVFTPMQAFTSTFVWFITIGFEKFIDANRN
jgi:hypothetical protein